MEKIYNSASKIVFIIMALALVFLTYVGKIEAKDFVMLASMAFAFYFTKDGVKTGGGFPQSSQVINTPEVVGSIVADDNFKTGDDIQFEQIKQ